ncbi:PREDICTED: disintegrin and metalloproteinase domain-containing protein 32-like [Nipponia nippon]|uniref:disintegrin and metalloproteinase domain-containing protein 32-like n=1 Tax=Nipponia nippon TaxID=128390 RepID=UPI000510B6FC|nr:PREDICTED: disintegrin and metalloproteinase domain-containing protein 32-like [Nipponia nippon]
MSPNDEIVRFVVVFLNERFAFGVLAGERRSVRRDAVVPGVETGRWWSQIEIGCTNLLKAKGLLQFENVSYGIEPLDYSPAFEHFVYRVSDEQTAGSLFANSHRERGPGGLTPLSAAARSPKYFKVHVILDKALYNYMGSDTNAATQKIIQVFSLVNNMFHPLNTTVVLSSLELWTEENKISTAGEADDLLQRFLQWKQSYLALRSYDIAYLLVYRDRAAFVGATAPGKACQRNAAGAVAVYQGAVTLESFSVLLAQLLGRSLGISYDSSRGCRCPGSICLMSPEALRLSGAKAFSSCSIRDFETFLRHNRGACLFSRPRLTGLSYRRAAVCGNGVVEPGEQCDCGAAAVGAAGITAKCAKNAPLACYEEVNSQQDRFGHCGNHPKDGYQPCSWPNLGCGKLVCTYPNRIPFTKVKGAIIYAQVQEHLCVSFDFMRGPTALDPLLVKEGTKCGPGKVCLNGTCHPHSVLKYDCNVQKKCHGHGVCNNNKNCHCDPGWNPPRCKTRGFPVGRGTDSALGPDHIAQSSAPAVLKNWLLLSFSIVLLLALVCGTVMIMKRNRLKRFCARRGSQMDG